MMSLSELAVKIKVRIKNKVWKFFFNDTSNIVSFLFSKFLHFLHPILQKSGLILLSQTFLLLMHP